MTAQSSAVWFSKILALAAPYDSMSGCRSRWSGEKFSITAIHGWNVSICSSWKLLASTTWTVSGVDPDTCALSGAPILPPTVTRYPAASRIWPVSAVVVDFPFVPGDRHDAARRATATPAPAPR